MKRILAAIGVMALFCCLTVLSGCGSAVGGDGGGNNGGITPPSGSSSGSGPMADAASAGYSEGANLVRWKSPGSRTLAFLLYRDTNTAAPIAVIDSRTLRYIDSAARLPEQDAVMESNEVEISLDQDSGQVTSFTSSTTYDTDTTELNNSDMSVSEDTFNITARRVPLAPGQMCGYQLRVVYMTMVSEGGDSVGLSDRYVIRVGNISQPSTRMTLLAPPELEEPADGQVPLDGNYRCARVTGATDYLLQLSADDPGFSANHILSVPLGDPGNTVIFSVDFPTLYQNSVLKNASVIYWRIGARTVNQPMPVALSDRNQNGWVFSHYRAFNLPTPPPGP